MEHDKGVLVEVVDKLDRLEKMLVSKCGDLTLVDNFDHFFGKWWDLLDLP